MVNTGGDEEHVAGFERVVGRAILEGTVPGDDDIEFVTGVGRLQVAAAWRVILHDHAAMCQRRDGEIAGRR